MHFSQMKIAMQAMQDEIRQAAIGTKYKYNLPLVLMTVSEDGVGVTVCIGSLERKASSLQSFDEAIIEAMSMTKWVCAQLDVSALARTLGVETAHA